MAWRAVARRAKRQHVRVKVLRKYLEIMAHGCMTEHVNIAIAYQSAFLWPAILMHG